MLKAHNERALATLPSVLNRFTQKVDRVLAKESVLPISQIDVTGGEDRTLVTSVFISEIPHTSVEDVYAGVLSYFESMSTSMKLHCDINVKRTRLNRDDASPSYWKSVFENEVGLPAVVNHVMCSELTSSHGIAHLDSVIDSLHPSSSNEYDINGLTLTPQKESSTGRTVSVMLRCVVVYRFNMHPDNPSLQRKFEKIRPILNGDLITTAICSYIKKNAAAGQTPDSIQC
ncbi:hypothetical protein AM587_10016755 [Phytophthora nicotianae]|uniref:Uncharacterized protein n=1 Tax=Phytophthora nicotianae TaxID=4792 RepID=A0A0W8DVK8_PHYNI|nr:hypothetical protein AM587_10016755 [Phytophthora nicotianae]